MPRRIGVQVRRWREEQGLTQSALVRRLEDALRDFGREPPSGWWSRMQAAMSRLELGIYAPPDPGSQDGQALWTAVARVLLRPEPEVLGAVKYELRVRRLDEPELREELVRKFDRQPELAALTEVHEVLEDASRRIAAAFATIHGRSNSFFTGEQVLALLEAESIPWTATGYLPAGIGTGHGRKRPTPARADRTAGFAADLGLEAELTLQEGVQRLDGRVIGIILRRAAPADVADLCMVMTRRICVSAGAGIAVDWSIE